MECLGITWTNTSLSSWMIFLSSNIEDEHEKFENGVSSVERALIVFQVKLNKCTFYQKQIHYLGHVVSEDSIAVDWEKMASTKESFKSEILYGITWIL
jgi:hypothetical protein